MKKTIITAVLMCFWALGAKADTVIVEAGIKELPAGKWIYYREQGGNDARDSVLSFQGGFKFEINIEEGDGDLYLFSIERNFDDNNSLITLFLDKGTVHITAQGKDFKDAILSGSASANDLQAYRTAVQSNELFKKLPGLYERGNELYQKGDTAAL